MVGARADVDGARAEVDGARTEMVGARADVVGAKAEVTSATAPTMRQWSRTVSAGIPVAGSVLAQQSESWMEWLSGTMEKQTSLEISISQDVQMGRVNQPNRHSAGVGRCNREACGIMVPGPVGGGIAGFISRSH